MKTNLREYRPIGIVLLCGGLVFVLMVALGAAHWHLSRQQSAAMSRHDYLLQGHADYSKIVAECRAVIVPQPPQVSGNAYPNTVPPYVSTLGASSIRSYQGDGVLLVFDRSYGLFVTESEESYLPQWVRSYTPQELYPGLWYFAY